MKTSELTGAALDWAVAKCEGVTDEWREDGPFLWNGVPCIRSGGHDVNYRPSTEWWLGGPIIEREAISIAADTAGMFDTFVWFASVDDILVDAEDAIGVRGPTPLIAAMRCYCCAKLGDEVEVPEELQ